MNAFGGFHYGFGNCRVRMHRVAQLFRGRFQLHGHAGFSDQFRGMRADDVHAQNFVILTFADYLHKAFLFAEDARLARSAEGKLAQFYVIAGFARLRFS